MNTLYSPIINLQVNSSARIFTSGQHKQLEKNVILPNVKSISLFNLDKVASAVSLTKSNHIENEENEPKQGNLKS